MHHLAREFILYHVYVHLTSFSTEEYIYLSLISLTIRLRRLEYIHIFYLTWHIPILIYIFSHFFISPAILYHHHNHFSGIRDIASHEFKSSMCLLAQFLFFYPRYAGSLAVKEIRKNFFLISSIDVLVLFLLYFFFLLLLDSVLRSPRFCAL